MFFDKITNAESIKSNTMFFVQNEAECVYFLKAGSADLFYIEKFNGKSGRRTYLSRLDAPALIPSFPISDEFEIALNSLTEIEVSTIAATKVCGLDENSAEELAKLIDEWLIKFSQRLDKYALPSHFINIDPSGAISATAGGVLCPSDFGEVLWLEKKNANVELFGKFKHTIKENEYFPITKNLWYSVIDDVRLSSFPTKALVQTEGFFSRLSKLNLFYSEVLKAHSADNLKESLIRVKGAKNYRSAVIADALYTLKEVIPGEKSAEARLADSGGISEEDLLFKTMSLIGEYEKIEFKKPKRFNKRNTLITNILKASNIRSRTIKLDEGWQFADHGALLCELEDGTPIAMLPKNSASYKYIDLKNNKRYIVTKNNLPKLKPNAQCFYSPLPKKQLTGRDLFNFAAKFTYKDITAFFVIGVIGAILALIMPFSVGYIFNEVIPVGSQGELLQLALLLISVAITLSLLNYAKSIAILRAEGRSSYKVQAAIWDRILSLEVNFFKKYSPGDLAQRSMGIEQIKESLSNVIVHSIVAGIFSVFYLALLFYYDWLLALIALVLGLIIVTFTMLISYFAYKHIVNIKRSEAIIAGFLLQIMRGIAKIRVTDSKDSVFSIWAKKFAQQKEAYSKKRFLLVIAEVFRSVFPVFGSLVIFIKVHSLYTTGEFSVGDFVAFNMAFGSFQGALLQMAMATVPFITIKPTFNMMKPILEAELENDDKQDPGELRGSIEISHLNFKYNEEQDWILRDISMKIEPGQFVALVGSSGSGKSTLMRILLGFEKYKSGSVYFDGKELNDLNIRDVREQLGVVLQNSKILQGTILFNIIGSSALTEEDAWRAAAMAGCEDDIKGLPNGMHTILPAGGGTLSGGQQQRLIIARSLVRNPKIFIFDEATSALDNHTQKIVSDSVEKLNTTRIVIAHRLSTIINADKIFVMDKGRLIEEGNYDELMKLNGFFANLAKRQIA